MQFDMQRLAGKAEYNLQPNRENGYKKYYDTTNIYITQDFPKLHCCLTKNFNGYTVPLILPDPGYIMLFRNKLYYIQCQIMFVESQGVLLSPGKICCC